MNNDNQNTLLIGVEKAAKLMNVSRNTMLKLVKMKGFPALILPHKILIAPQALPDWIRMNYGTFKR